jgi:hypothetical protein
MHAREEFKSMELTRFKLSISLSRCCKRTFAAVPTRPPPLTLFEVVNDDLLARALEDAFHKLDVQRMDLIFVLRLFVGKYQI